jgi:hypothetical protein
MPQFHDDETRPWDYWRKYAEIWLAHERFVVISGLEGTRT